MQDSLGIIEESMKGMSPRAGRENSQVRFCWQEESAEDSCQQFCASHSFSSKHSYQSFTISANDTLLIPDRQDLFLFEVGQKVSYRIAALHACRVVLGVLEPGPRCFG